ncbi:hypothetical protein tinsulaeT_20780 [Thalassotalea insulae]|uniref:Uncharacterized protein n=1 Tax=Thalassotalea insulae TaxID=2056778 RepID=A0ABQ6GS17_9GAMM|nr:hypothetical protein [Thalassotalea insulae]GLX78738.1 hypothetical protein tinsulaeT_20780 [Thalassotalea insulae]
MKKLVILGLSVVSLATVAEGNLTKLKVAADVVYFATDEVKQHGLPACVASASEQEWAVSLNTATGKAMYSLLVTASASNRKITVTSANDCADAVGFERAHSVELGEVNSSDDYAKSVYLYKADGVTKVGRFVSLYQDHADEFWYLPINNDVLSTSLQRYTPDGGNSSLYFKLLNCGGDGYADRASQVGRNKYRYGGKFYTSMPTSDGKGFQSKYEYRNGVLSCVNSANSSMITYPLDLTLGDPLCGENLCVLKEE